MASVLGPGLRGVDIREEGTIVLYSRDSYATKSLYKYRIIAVRLRYWRNISARVQYTSLKYFIARCSRDDAESSAQVPSWNALCSRRQ